MQEYLMRRLLLLIPTIIGVTLIVFLMMRVIPGDPVANMMGEAYSEADAQRLRRELGLHQPVLLQYCKWLGLLVQGGLGAFHVYQSAGALRSPLPFASES